MLVNEVMTKNPTFCSPETSLDKVAKLMRHDNCGAIPVVRKEGENYKAVGIITDRDIVMRALAESKNPIEMTAKNCMSQSVITISKDAGVNECIHKMEKNKIRRILVTNSEGNCCGIVSQADIALHSPHELTAELVEMISKL